MSSVTTPSVVRGVKDRTRWISWILSGRIRQNDPQWTHTGHALSNDVMWVTYARHANNLLHYHATAALQCVALQQSNASLTNHDACLWYISAPPRPLSLFSISEWKGWLFRCFRKNFYLTYLCCLRINWWKCRRTRLRWCRTFRTKSSTTRRSCSRRNRWEKVTQASALIVVVIASLVTRTLPLIVN